MDALRNAVSDFLRLRSIDRHRSRIGWRAPRYFRYLARAQAAYDGPLPMAGDLSGAIAQFARDGVTAFQNDTTEAIADKMMARISERENAGETLWDADKHEIGNQNYAGDLWKDFPEIEDLFRGPVGTFLNHHFQASFKILYGVLYRSTGGERAPSGSQRWHSDSGPGICVNVMFYLHETSHENGTLEALPWAFSRDIYAAEPAAIRARARTEGVDPRSAERFRLMADFYDDAITEELRQTVIRPQGRAGVVVPFLNNTLHRGGFPEPGYTRTAIVFHCYPSHEPTDFERYRRLGINKSAPYPRDPAEKF